MKKAILTIVVIVLVLASQAQHQPFSAGETGLSVRTKINAQFSQLYDNITSFQYSADSLTWVDTASDTDNYFRYSTNLGGTRSKAFKLFDGKNLSGDLNMNTYKITGLSGGTGNTDAVTLQQLVDSINATPGFDPGDPVLIQSDTVDLVVTYTALAEYLGSQEITKTVYSLSLPTGANIAARVADAVEGTDYPTGWELSVAGNQIDLIVTHSLSRRVADVNVCGVSGTVEQQLRPYAGAYSGWLTNDANTLTINSISTMPLPLRVYIIFE